MIEWYSSLVMIILFPILIGILPWRFSKAASLLVFINCLCFYFYALDFFKWYFFGILFVLVYPLLLFFIIWKKRTLEQGSLKFLISLSILSVGLTTYLQFPRNISVQIPSPFKENQKYLVLHGGDSNHHQRWHSFKKEYHFAFDLIPVSDFYRAIKGFWPGRNEDFQGFKKEILSPCEGVVLRQYKDLSNNLLDQPKSHAIPGNHIHIQCKNGLTIALENLGEHQMELGQKVLLGQVVAKVGNTGLSHYPHLHIHVLKEGRPIPFRIKEN